MALEYGTCFRALPPDGSLGILKDADDIFFLVHDTADSRTEIERKVWDPKVTVLATHIQTVEQVEPILKQLKRKYPELQNAIENELDRF